MRLWYSVATGADTEASKASPSADTAGRRGTKVMELKEILFTKTADAVERYAANNKLLGAEDTRTKEALAAFKAVYGIVAAAELEADYQVWRMQEQGQLSEDNRRLCYMAACGSARRGPCRYDCR